jgi:ArsR family transcriptional regulator
MDFSETYRALGDESRLRIVHCLSRGMLNVQELTGILGLAQPTVSHHLKVLQQAGVIQLHREGTNSFFSLAVSDQPEFIHSTVESFLAGLRSLNGSFGATPYARDQESTSQILSGRREQARAFFERVAGEWNSLKANASNEESYVAQLARLVPGHQTLLELGCGAGNFLRQVLPRPGTTIAVDYSTAMLEETRRQLGTQASAVDLRLGYLEHLPVADRSVDVAVTHMVLHHLANPLDAIRDLARVVRPGGTVHIIDLAKHANEFMRERYADIWLGFEPSQIVAWLESVGFVGGRWSSVLEGMGDGKDAFLVSAERSVTS